MRDAVAIRAGGASSQGQPVLYPPPSTTELVFITDNDLRESIRRDVGAANRAFHNAEWKAATVLGGATIEALLFWKLNQNPPTPIGIKAAIQSALSKGILKKLPPTPLDEWGLHQFIEVAGEMGLLKEKAVMAARISKDFRNLIHPGRAAKEDMECDRGTALSALAALEHVIRDLT